MYVKTHEEFIFEFSGLLESLYHGYYEYDYKLIRLLIKKFEMDAVKLEFNSFRLLNMKKIKYLGPRSRLVHQIISNRQKRREK